MRTNHLNVTNVSISASTKTAFTGMYSQSIMEKFSNVLNVLTKLLIMEDFKFT